MAEAVTRGPRKDEIGLITCASLVAGNMIGSGIFLLPASLAPYGGISLLGWAISTLGAICLALVFSRLASRLPAAGGPYAYTRAGFGDFPAFWVAWGYWVSVWIGNAAIAVAMVSYLQVFVPALGTSLLLAEATALLVVWGLAAVNCIGIKEAGSVQVVSTVLKILPLLALGLLGLPRIHLAHFTFSHPGPESGFSALSAVTTLTLWSFLGVECATIPAGNVRDPARTIPRATILGTLAAAAVYVLGTVAVMGIVPPEELARSGAPFADAARSLWGEGAYYVVGLGAAISCFGALNGWTLVMGQVPMAAARDGLFPRRFGRLSRRGVPAFGLIVSSFFVTGLLALNYSRSGSLVKVFNFAILLATLTVLVPYVFCAGAELMFLARDRSRPPGSAGAGSLLAATVAFLFSVWAIYGSGAETVLYGFLLLVAGVPVYVWLRRREAEESA